MVNFGSLRKICCDSLMSRNGSNRLYDWDISFEFRYPVSSFSLKHKS